MSVFSALVCRNVSRYTMTWRWSKQALYKIRSKKNKKREPHSTFCESILHAGLYAVLRSQQDVRGDGVLRTKVWKYQVQAVEDLLASHFHKLPVHTSNQFPSGRQRRGTPRSGWRKHSERKQPAIEERAVGGTEDCWWLRTSHNPGCQSSGTLP